MTPENLLSRFALFESFSGVRFTLALIHFLWLGGLFALAVAALSRLLRKASANSRYLLHLSALIALAAGLPLLYLATPADPVRESPVGHSFRDATSPAEVSASRRPELPVSAGGPSPDRDQQAVAIPFQLAPPDRAPATSLSPEGRSGEPLSLVVTAAPHVAIAYCVGVWLMFARLAAGLWGGRLLRRSALPVTDSELIAMVARQCWRLRLSAQPGLAWCDRVATPAVVGILKPTILLPAALISGLQPQLIESLLVHELAHIHRWDLATNLLQRVIESLLFFHPAVWYLSTRVSAERENACDDLVLSAGWPRLQYAEALLQMAEASVGTRDRLIAASTAGLLAGTGESTSQFKRRVLRVVQHEELPRLGWSRGILVSLLLAAILAISTPIVLQAWGTGSREGVVDEESQPAAEGGEATDSDDGFAEDPIEEVLALLAEAPWEHDEQLNAELLALDRLRPQPVAEIEKFGRELLDRYDQPAAQGRIYYQLAHVFAQKNIRDHASRVAHYAPLALQHDHHPERNAMARGYLASSANFIPEEADADARRRESTRLWLENYRELLPLKLPKNAPDLPGVGKVGSGFEDPAERARNLLIQNAQVRARAKARLIRELVKHRQICARLVVEAYRRREPADAELRELALDVLHDQRLVEQVLSEGIALRVGEDRPMIEWQEENGMSPTGLDVELSPASRVDRTSAGLKLSVRIANRSPHDLETTLEHEWHGGEWPHANLYAAVTPHLEVNDAPFKPVYLLGEQAGKGAPPTTIETGRATDVDLRLDWPGTGSVKGTPLLAPDKPGVYRVRLLLAFQSNNGWQYAISPTALVTLPPPVTAAGPSSRPAPNEVPAESSPNPERPQDQSKTEGSTAIPPGVLVATRVVDARTGKPIEAFRVIPGVPYTRVKGPDDPAPAVWQPHLLKQAKAGRFDWLMERSYEQFRLRFESEGYIPAFSPWIKKTDRPLSIVIPMTRDPGVKGRVFKSNGSPAAGAVLAIAMPNRGVRLKEGRIVGADEPPNDDPVAQWRRPILVRADDQGHFRLPTEPGAVKIYAVHDAGIAETDYDELRLSTNIELVEWGAIDGRVLWIDRPGVKEPLSLSIMREAGGYPEVCSEFESVMTDDAGRFRIDRLPPWSVQLARSFPLPGENQGAWLFPHLQVQVKEGRPTEVVFGGPGRTVRGKLTGLDSYDDVRISIAPNFPRPGDALGMTGHNLVRNSNLGPVFFRDGIEVDADGTFEIEQVLPAHYQLFVRNGVNSLSQVERLQVDPPPADDLEADFDLGTIKLKKRENPAKPEASIPKSMNEKLAAIVSLNVIDRPLVEVLDRLEKEYKVPVTVAHGEMLKHAVSLETRLSVEQTDVSLKTLFEAVARGVELDVEFNEQGVRIPRSRDALLRDLEESRNKVTLRRNEAGDVVALSVTGQGESGGVADSEFEVLAFDFATLPGLRSLESLKLQNLDISAPAFAQFVESRELKELSIVRCRVEGEILGTISRLHSLRVLQLPGFPLDDAGLELIAALRELEVLDVSNDRSQTGAQQVTVQGMVSLAKLRNLRELDVSSHAIGDPGLVPLSTLPLLKGLSIRFAGVSKAGLRELQRCVQLEALALGGRSITAGALAELETLRPLHSLSLDSVKIDEVGLAQLRSLKGLKELSLTDTDLSGKSADALQRARPGTRITVFVGGRMIWPRPIDSDSASR